MEEEPSGTADGHDEEDGDDWPYHQGTHMVDEGSHGPDGEGDGGVFQGADALVRLYKRSCDFCRHEGRKC